MDVARDPRRPTAEALLEELGDPLDPDRYDWTRAANDALTDEEIFQLTYATHVEWGTEGYFASLDISRDPTVRRFLAVWLEQERAHAQLLARFLGKCGVRVEPVHTQRRHRRSAQRGKRVNQLARLVFGDDFFGVHMTWGAVNELTTLRFYGLIRGQTRHTLLRELLRDLMTQEAAHFNFYRSVAHDRLDGSRRGQRLTRWAMEHLWDTVGVGLRTQADADRLVVGLFGDQPALVASMDAALNRIPGMDGLDIASREVAAAQARGALRSRRFRSPWASRFPPGRDRSA